MKREQQASQGPVDLVAYQMGLQCPMGKEIKLVLSLDRWWPDIHTRPAAKREFLRGLADRRK